MNLVTGSLAMAALLFSNTSRGQDGATPSTAQVPTMALVQAGKIPDQVMQGGSAVIGDRFYVFGGKKFPKNKNWEYTNDVHSAKIKANGTLGKWRTEVSLPDYLVYISQAVEVVNNRIYIVAGSTFETSSSATKDVKHSRTVLWSEIDNDGVLQPWQRSDSQLQTAVSCHATCSSDRFLYLIGGQNNSLISDSVWVAPFAADGKPLDWKQLGALPVPLWFHGAAILEDRVFVWGGLTARENTSTSDKVYSADVHEDGTFGPWTTQKATMPIGVYSSAFCGFNDFLAGVGGRYARGVATNSIWYARVERGIVGEWQHVETNLATRIFHTLGLHKARGLVYIAGGMNPTSADNLQGVISEIVQLFQITQPKEKQLFQPAELVQAGAGSATLQVVPDIKEALKRAGTEKKNLLVFFYSPEVPACKRSWDILVSNPDLVKSAGKRVLAAIDTTQDGGMTACYQYNVFKVPCMIELTFDGKLVEQTMRLNDASHFRTLLGNTQ